MTIRNKIVEKHMKLLPKMMRAPVQKIKICEKLLERHFNISDKNETLTEDKIIAYLIKRKKASFPHRADAIKALTIAWVEMTGSPAEKLKKNVEQESYGKFHNYNCI